MKKSIATIFVALAALVSAPAFAEVPCQDGYVYVCNEYDICGCVKPSGTTISDSTISGNMPELGDEGSDLLIVNNGDGSDFLEDAKALLDLGLTSEEFEKALAEMFWQRMESQSAKR